MKELVCIVCPKGCRLRVDEENGYLVSGNSCIRGAEYGKNEILNPTRVLTSTVKMEGGLYRRCPVKTNKAIPKAKLFDVMETLNGITLSSPVSVGQVVVENVCGTGADVITTKAL